MCRLFFCDHGSDPKVVLDTDCELDPVKTLVVLKIFLFLFIFESVFETNRCHVCRQSLLKKAVRTTKVNSPAYMTFSKKAVSLISLFAEPYVSSLKYPPLFLL